MLHFVNFYNVNKLFIITSHFLWIIYKCYYKNAHFREFKNVQN